MGQVRKRGRLWWIRYYRAGRRHEESSGTDRKQVAIDLLRLREGDLARGLPVSAKLARLRFEEAAADVTNDYRTNGKRSLDEVERRIRLHLTPCFGGRRLAAITTSDVRAYIAKRQADTTVTRAHTPAAGRTARSCRSRRTIGRLTAYQMARSTAS